MPAEDVETTGAGGAGDAGVMVADNRAAHLDDDEDEEKPKKKRRPRNKAFLQKLEQDASDVNYSAVRAITEGGDRACANCRWFIKGSFDNQCAIVQEWPEPIEATGLSDRWEAVPVFEAEPFEVVIVDQAALDAAEDDDGSFMDQVRKALKSARDLRFGDRATTKRERGIDFPKAAYAWSPGSEVSNWAIRLWTNLDDKVTRRQLGAAAAAFSPGGFRGNRVKLKDADGKVLSGEAKTAADNRVKARIRREFRALGVETGDIPASVKEMGAVAIGLLGSDGDEDLGFGLLEGPGFRVFGDKETGYRWLGWTTNKWRDREGDVFSEAAHKEYVAARDAGSPPGDVWFWHTPGTSFAECDFVDYVDGFLVESGPFKKGQESWAEQLGEGEWAMSHTFVAEPAEGDPTVFMRYRIVERGPLPRDAAANPWTGFAVNSKEAPMGFSPEKKKALTEHLGEEAVTALEDASETFRGQLEEAGIDSKELDETHGLLPDDEPEGDPEPEGDGGDEQKLEAAPADVEAIVEGVKNALGLDDLVEGLKAIIANQEDLGARMAAIEKTDDQKIAEKIQPSNGKSMFGFMASTAKSTKVDGRTKAAKEGPEYEEAPEGAKGAGGLIGSLGAMGTVAGKAALEAEAEAGASSAEGVL